MNRFRLWLHFFLIDACNWLHIWRCDYCGARVGRDDVTCHKCTDVIDATLRHEGLM